MASFNAKDIDNYGGQGGAGYFSLKNDKDTAVVRFMYETVDDIEGYAVHQAVVNDKNRWVNCLRAYDEPIDKCPFCREHKPQQVKLFIPIYDPDSDRVKVWERGKKFYATLSGTFSRIKGKIVSTPFEIERNGKQGDTQTTYGIYPLADERDDMTLEDLPEKPKIIGSIILDKSKDDMEFYLENGEFPPEDDMPPIRRRSERQSERHDDYEEENSRPTRRTPARRNNGDKF